MGYFRNLTLIIAFSLALCLTSSLKGEETSFSGTVRLTLPSVIYTTPGVETNIYFDNIVLIINPDNYIFDVTCEKGFQYDERWTYLPKTEEAGDYPITIEVRDGANAVIAKTRSIVRVASVDINTDKNRTLLAFGDSNLQRSFWPQHVLDLSKADPNFQLSLIGTRGADNKPAIGELKHEGYNGWTAQAFATMWGPQSRTGHFKRPETGSPFIYKDEQGNEKLDFERYCREFNHGQAPDFVVINIGGNDIFRCTDDNIDTKIDEVFGYCDKLIGMIYDYSKKTKVGMILLAPPSRKQYSFRNYKGTRKQTRWQYRRNQHRLVERMIAKYDKREPENIFLIPVYTNIDTLHGYVMRSYPINARMPEKISRVLDGVHLSPEGYRQYGDTIYCWMKVHF